MRPVFQKNIIAVNFLCFEAHLSRALYGGRFWEGVYVQLTVFQKNIIAVDFLCFEAHLSRALFGGRF